MPDCIFGAEEGLVVGGEGCGYGLGLGCILARADRVGGVGPIGFKYARYPSVCVFGLEGAEEGGRTDVVLLALGVRGGLGGG